MTTKKGGIIFGREGFDVDCGILDYTRRQLFLREAVFTQCLGSLILAVCHMLSSYP